MTLSQVKVSNFQNCPVLLEAYVTTYAPKAKQTTYWQLQRIVPLILFDLKALGYASTTYLLDTKGRHWKVIRPFCEVYERFFSHLAFRYQTWANYLSFVSGGRLSYPPFVYGRRIYCYVRGSHHEIQAWVNLDRAVQVMLKEDGIGLTYPIETPAESLLLPDTTSLLTQIEQARHFIRLYQADLEALAEDMALTPPGHLDLHRQFPCFSSLPVTDTSPFPITVAHFLDIKSALTTYEYLLDPDPSHIDPRTSFLSRNGFDSKTLHNALKAFRFREKQHFFTSFNKKSSL